MSVIRQSYIVHAASGKVWEALNDVKGPTKAFREMWKITPMQVKPKKCLIFKIGRSQVQISLTYENQRTYIDLLQEEVPDRDRDRINKGWKESFFEPLKDMVEKSTGV